MRFRLLKPINGIVILIFAICIIAGFQQTLEYSYADIGLNVVADIDVMEVSAGLQSIYVRVYADDNSTSANVRITIGGSDVHTVKTKELTESPGFFAYEGFITTNLTGLQTVKLEVEDLYQGQHNKWVAASQTYTVDIQSLDSFIVKLDKESCYEFSGEFVAGVSNYLKIGKTSTNKDTNIPLYYVTRNGIKYCRFNIYSYDGTFERGTKVYASIGVDSYGSIRSTATFDGSHMWGEGTVETASTCKSDGVRKYKCTVCGDYKTETIPIAPDAHKWNSGKVTKPNGYTHTGVKTYTCTECGLTRSSAIAKLNAAAVTPARVTLSSAKVSGKKLTLKWKRVAKNTKGYQVAIKNKKTKKVKYYNVGASSKSKISKKIKLKKGTYAVMVRAYNVVNGETIYGKWSNVKVGKVK